MKTILMILLLSFAGTAQIPIKRLRKSVVSFTDKGKVITNLTIVAIDTSQNIIIGSLTYLRGDGTEVVTSSDAYFYYRGVKKDSPFNLTLAERRKLRALQIRRRR